MKRMTVALVVLMTVAFASSALADNPKRKQRVLKKYDTNRDGVLSQAERAKLRRDRQVRRAAMVKRFDKDGDGVLNQKEQRAARMAMKGQRLNKRFGQLLKRFDKNGDKALSLTELKAAKAPRIQQRFSRADTNHDGVVTRAEFVAAAKNSKRGRRGKRGQRGKRGAGTQ